VYDCIEKSLQKPMAGRPAAKAAAGSARTISTMIAQGMNLFNPLIKRVKERGILMKKSRFVRMITLVLAVVMVFAFTATAFAHYYVDTGTWSASICLYGFTTRDKAVKYSDETWESTTVYVDEISFASDTGDAYLWATPKTSSGYTMGGPDYCNQYCWPDIAIEDYEESNKMFLRIDNPHPGDNMVSEGQWDGYIV
jgi:hypothetical protein